MLRKLASNTLVGLAGTVAQKGIAFLTTLVLARGLGQDGFGVYSFVGVYIFFFAFIVDLGMDRVVTREISEAPERVGHLLGNAIILKLCLCVLAIPAAYVVGRLMHVPAEAQHCILIAALGLPLSMDLLFRGYFQSQYQVKLIYAVTLPAATLFLLLAILCVHWALPVHVLFYAALVNGALTLALLLAIALPRIRLVMRPEPELMKRLLRDAGEMGLFILLFVVAMRIDQILLFKLRGAVEVGRYAVSVRVTEALSILPEALMLTVFPILASSQTSAPERFRHTYRLSFKYLSAIILPLALALTLCRDPFVRFVFGAQYSASAAPLAILGWGMFFAYTGAVYLNLFIVQRHHRLMLLVSLVAVAVNIIANLCLIPPFGATGAAAAMVIGNVAGFMCWAVHPATARYMAVCMAEAVRPVLAVALAAGLAAVLQLEGLVAAAATLGVYLAAMVALRGFSWSDVELVRRLFAAEPAA